jgi:ribosome biogenesis GTPase
MTHDLDEDDVRIRPSRSGSRPRSKQRPRHAEASEGMVVAVDRGRYTVLVDATAVTAMRARELGRSGIVVGDRVALVGDLSGSVDALARIVRRADRSSVLRRTADDTDPTERVVVANADQLVIVASLADPPPRYGFIDRCLVAALTEDIEPLLCLTKADLAPPDDVLAHYSELSVPVVVTQRGGDLSQFTARLEGQVSVFIGQSGVGKSTLINALVPAADRATGEVSAIGKGRHISASTEAMELPGGGWVIDTPGVRSFGLAHVTAPDLLWAFPDLEDGAVQCPPGCDHQSAAAGCHLDAWVREGHSSPTRLAAFRRLLASRAGM